MSKKYFYLVCEADPETFEITVTDLLNAGWAPVGSVVVRETNPGPTFYLGMMRTYEEQNDETKHPD